MNTISILGEEVEVEVVEGYRYLGIHLDNRLDWTVTLKLSTGRDR